MMRKTAEIAFPLFVGIATLIWLNTRARVETVVIAMDDTALFRCVDVTEPLLAKAGGEVAVDYFVTNLDLKENDYE